MNEKREIYLDNSATTRCFPQVAALMNEIYLEDYGNPSSMHHKGVTAERRVAERGEAEQHVGERDAPDEPARAEHFEPIVEKAHEVRAGQGVVAVHDRVEQRLADGLRRVVAPVDAVEAAYLGPRAVPLVEVVERLAHLREHGAADLAPLPEDRLARPLEDGQLERERALVGEQQREVREEAVLPDEPERPPLRGAERDLPLPEERRRRAEREVLPQRPHPLERAVRRREQHFADRRLRRRHGRRVLPDEDALGTEPLRLPVVGARRAALHVEAEDGPSAPLLLGDRDERAHVRPDRIADQVADADARAVDVVHPADRPVVVHADEDRPAVRVGEGDHRLADLVRVFALVFQIQVFEAFHRLVSSVVMT